MSSYIAQTQTADVVDLPDQHHPEHLRRRLRRRQCPAGAVHLGAVRLRADLARATRGKPVLDAASRARRKMMFSVVGMVMWAAPLGAFGAIAFTVGKFGVGSLVSLGKLLGELLRHLPHLHVRRASARSRHCVRLQPARS